MLLVKDLPNDIDMLKQLVLNIDAAHEAELKQQQKNYEQEIAELKEQLKLALLRRYVRKSEKYVESGQQSIFDEAAESAPETEAEESEEAKAPTAPKGQAKRPAQRRPLPSYIPREVVRHELSEAELLTPEGLRYEPIGVHVSEVLEFIPAKVVVKRHERVKYAIKGREELGVKIAPLSKAPILPKTQAGPSLLAHVAVSKYCHHLPLYRQSQIWSSLDIDLPRNTLCRWMMQVGERCGPLAELLLTEMKSHRHIHVDETPVKMLGSEKKGYMWCYHNEHGTFYDYQSGRSGSYAAERLKDYEGVVQHDAFSGYNQLFTPGSGHHSAGCLAHARRKFHDVLKASGKKKSAPLASYVLKEIGQLYKIEKICRELSPTEREKLRQEKARPIMEKLHKHLVSKQALIPPGSLMGKAVSYLLNHYTELSYYLKNGLVPIDNNPVERKIRPFALGRKNWLFHGSLSGARSAANLYSLIETAKDYGLNPQEYLRELFENLPEAQTTEHLQALLPRAVAQHKKTGKVE